MATDKLEHALSLARRGLRVFPLIENGRTPAFAGWQDAATSDMATLAAWFGEGGTYSGHNLAVATGRGIAVFDADVKNGGRGLQSIELLEMVGADFLFMAETPSGGRHGYVALPEGVEVPNSVRALAGYPDVDVRGRGGYVAAPGSTIDGRAYKVLRDGPITEAPAYLIELARSAKKLREKAAGSPAADLDTTEAIDRAVFYLGHNAPLAVEGAGGDDTTYRVAAHIKDYGLSEAATLDLLLGHWNERCSPPWEVEDLEAKVASAYRSGTSAPGAKSAMAEFDVVEIERKPKGASKDIPAFVIPSQFGDETPPPREWAVEGWIPARKTTLLTGDGGIGKTLVAQQLLTAVATPGATWFGKQVIHGPVLGVFSEDDRDEMWRRQIDICRQAGIPITSLDQAHWWTSDEVAASGCVLMTFTRENPEGKLSPFFKMLDEAMSRVKPALTVLDPIANMFGGNELDRAQVTGFVNRTLNRLCVKHDTTMVALAHPSLSGMTEGTGRSGSTGWANAVRSRLYLTRPQSDPTGDYRVLKPTKNNYGRVGDGLTLRYSQGAFVSALGAENDPAVTTERALLMCIRMLIGRGETLSPNTRAGNYVIRKVKAMPEVEGVSATALEAAFERLLRGSSVWVETMRDGRGRSFDCIAAAPEQESFARADDFDLE